MNDTAKEADAAHLALLISGLKAKGQQMKFFDAAIAATALARGDKLLCADTDFDRRTDVRLTRGKRASEHVRSVASTLP
jgi:predicted nucleic acid-binding protein